MEFIYPFAFVLLPLPVLVRYLWTPSEKSLDGALRVPFYSKLAQAANSGKPEIARKPWRLMIASLIWCLLVAAAARPVLVGDEIPLPVEGRDLMLAIDLSGSMAREDFALDGQPSTRLAVVKSAASDFIERRSGDRIGLVLFSDRAYLQVPLTLDNTIVSLLLDEAQVGLTGTETAIGDAIAIAVKRLKDRPVESRVLILLTDGASNAGVLQPMQAAQLAKELGIRVYTIGVGAERMAVNTAYGRQIVNPSEDLDEKTLSEIAELTGGKYFRAQDVSSLAGIYSELDKLEPVSGNPVYIRPSVSLFFVPLAAAVLLVVLMGTVLLVASSGLWTTRRSTVIN